MQDAFDFEAVDFNELYTMLLDAARHAFRFAQESHPDETFYAFGLYYSKRAKFVYAACSSEEAHLSRHHLTAADRERQMLAWFYQRWSLRKWTYFTIEHKQFDPVSSWISRVWRSARLFPDTLIVWNNIDHKIENISLDILKTLDEEGLFGDGAARETVVLTFVIEDEYSLPDREEGERVHLLNPTSTYQRWRIEKEMDDHASAFLERDEDIWEER